MKDGLETTMVCGNNHFDLNSVHTSYSIQGIFTENHVVHFEFYITCYFVKVYTMYLAYILYYYYMQYDL